MFWIYVKENIRAIADEIMYIIKHCVWTDTTALRMIILSGVLAMLFVNHPCFASYIEL